MNTKARMIFLAGGLAITLASGWGAASASAIYENHFDVYRTLASPEAPREPVAKAAHPHVAKHRPAAPPVALTEAPNGKVPATH